MSYSWSIASTSGNWQASDISLTSNDESASIVASTDSSQAAAIQYTEVGSMTLQVVVDDGEDTATDTDEYHFCAGGFEDSDGDTYGDPVNYAADCSTSPIESTVPGNYILQSAFSSGAYSGVDCLDDGTIVDSGQGGSASIIQYTAAEITTHVKWYIDFDGDGYGSSGFEADDAAPQDGVLDDLASQSVTILYADGGAAVPTECVTTKPTVTVNGSTYSYVLNPDDCNDTQTFTDG